MYKYEAQKIQDLKYSFPYHYIPQFSPYFSQNYNLGGGLNYTARLEFIIKKISKIKFNSLCDVGTGDGRIVKELAEHINGKEIWGIDYSQRAIKLAQAMNPDLIFKKCDIVKETLDKKFDIITLIETFEHIPLDEIENFVRSLWEMLNENGTLLLTVPHKNLPLEKKHFQHFNPSGLEEYFAKHFTIEKTVLLGKQGKLQKIIKKILTNNLFILNQRTTKDLLYKTYKKYCLFAKEKDCERICMKLKKIN